MKTKILLFLLVVQILVSCSPTQKTTPDLTSEIPEFKEYFETLTKQSTEWEPDAYMYMVDIPIVQGFFCKKDLAYFGNRDENKETLAR